MIREGIMFSGMRNDLPERRRIYDLIYNLGVYNTYSLNSRSAYYYIERNEVMMVDRGSYEFNVALSNRIILPPESIILYLIKDIEERKTKWWSNLNIGSEVIINIDDQPEEYPIYMPQMARYNGQIGKITEIKRNIIHGPACDLQHYNGDSNSYLVEIKGTATWFHSSMFLSPDTTPVQMIELSDCSFLSKLL